MSSKPEKSEGPRPRGGRLARRARSFKEDFFGKISQIRTPAGHRSSSPQKNTTSENSKTKQFNVFTDGKLEQPEKGTERVQHFMNQLAKSLKYLQEVIRNEKLEMLPGSVTVALEMVSEIELSLRTCSPMVTDQSPQVKAATMQVFQSLASLMRWADEVSILKTEGNGSKENATEVVNAVQEAVKALVDLSLEKRHTSIKDTGKSIQQSSTTNSTSLHNGLCSPKSERTSLPDIPLTPREKEILEQTIFPTEPSGYSSAHPTTPEGQPSILHHSTSSDSILSPVSKPNGLTLGEVIPPPKPPLPNDRTANKTSQNSNGAPPLPPKKRSTTSGLTHLNQCQSATSGGFFPSSLTNSCHSSFLQEAFSSRASPSLDWAIEEPSPVESNLNHSADDLLLIKKTTNSIFHHRTKFQNEGSLNGRTAIVSDQGSKTISYSSTSYSSKKTSQVTSYKTELCGTSMDNILSNLQSSFRKMEAQTKEIVTSTVMNGNVIEPLESPSWPPPALPVKQRSGNRTLSQYDNVPGIMDNEPVRLSDTISSHNGLLEVDGTHCGHLTHSQSMIYYPGSSCMSTSLSTANNLCCPGLQQNNRYAGSCSLIDDCKPPPLPPKKRNIMAYMQMFGSYSKPEEGEFFRHSQHSYQVVAAKWQQEEVTLQSSFLVSGSSEISNINVVSSSDDSVFSESRSSQDSWDQFPMADDDSRPSSGSRLPAVSPSPIALLPVTPPALPPKKNRVSSGGNKVPELPLPPMEELTVSAPKSAKTSPVVESSPPQWSKESQELVEQGPLDELEVQNCIIFKKPEDEGPEIRGGPIDALIVFATKAPKNDFYYQEAFVTTYRTFISPYDLVQKLLYRYNRFIHFSDMRQRAARNAFSLLVRVVDDLCLGDLDKSLQKVLLDFIHQLVCHGDLILAKALRKKVVEKCEVKKQQDELVKSTPVVSHIMTTHQALLIDFKSEHLAEQMTLLDANLFQKIEIPELLLWAQEQKEELSPNLTRFTEHFNKMSYWARSRILDREDSKDRERYVIKFIKIMKHLRKLNNFNSYLAILSALDSAPIRRLEWQRTITEGLKEYCALIDSSSSFRAYRQALAETEPPCIPYIGLILQDLTFVHIGNQDLLPDGNVNFAKRWQQCNILENMRRFHNCQYQFKKDDAVLDFFNNFDQHLSEEAMWQISESIKPRGGIAPKKKQDQS